MKMNKKKLRHIASENGSAIIWILIAVGLFAALSFAFQSSNRTSSNLLTDEQARASAHQIISYGNDLKSAVKRLKLRGCDETEISFENNVIGGYTNAAAPTNKKCHLFDSKGGGLSVKTGLSSNSQSFTGDIPFENIGTTEPELSFQLSGVNRNTCLTINNIYNLSDSNSDDFEEAISPDPDIFTGTYGAVTVTDLAGDEVASLDGAKAYCRYDGIEFHYHSVLLVR